MNQSKTRSVSVCRLEYVMKKLRAAVSFSVAKTTMLGTRSEEIFSSCVRTEQPNTVKPLLAKEYFLFSGGIFLLLH